MAEVLSTSYGRRSQQNCDTKRPFNKRRAPIGAIHVEIDTGMSRYGCVPSELSQIVQACDDLDIPLEGLMTHLSNCQDKEFTKHQLDMFDECTFQIKQDRGVLLHVASSAGIRTQQGTQYDFVRPGVSIFGNPTHSVDCYVDPGYIPCIEIKSVPSSVKHCEASCPVGYGGSYVCPSDEWIATFPFGYAEGYSPFLSHKGAHVRRDKTGEKCPVVGHVMMNGIQVKLPEKPDPEEVFTIITADRDPLTSLAGLSNLAGVHPIVLQTSLSPTVPRMYTSAISQKRK